MKNDGTTHSSLRCNYPNNPAIRKLGKRNLVLSLILLAALVVRAPVLSQNANDLSHDEPSLSEQMNELRALEWLLHSSTEPPPCRSATCDPDFKEAPSPPRGGPQYSFGGNIDSLQFFVTQNAGACVAQSVTSKGTWTRIYQDSQSCGSFNRYQWIKGGKPSRPWATESWILRDGYLRIMIELHLNTNSGAITRYRAFRDYGGGYNPPPKGVRGLKRVLNGGQAAWNVPQYREEYWTGPNGVPACFNTNQTETTGSVTNGAATFLGVWDNWLQDRRAVSDDPSAWHDVEVVVRTETWGGSNVEYYYYGRWFDPIAQQWRGLGNIRWMWTRNGNVMGQNESHYLVDCPGVQVTCTTCPP